VSLFARLTIADRALFTAHLSTIFLTASIFTLMWMAPETLLKIAQQTISSNIPVGESLLVVLLSIPVTLQQTLPISVLLGSVLFYQDVQKHYEWLSMQVSGLSTRRLLLPGLVVGACYAMAFLLLMEVVIPPADQYVKAYQERYNLETPEHRSFVFFDRDQKTHSLRRLVVVDSVDALPKSGLLFIEFWDKIREPGYEPLIKTMIRAKAAKTTPLEGRASWVLVEPRYNELNEDGVQVSETLRKEGTLREPNKSLGPLLALASQRPTAIATSALARFVSLLQQTEQEHELPFYAVRLWQRVSLPLACVLFAIYGYGLSKSSIRAARHWGIALTALTMFIFVITQSFFAHLGFKGSIPPALAALGPLVTACVPALLLRLNDRIDRFRHT